MSGQVLGTGGDNISGLGGDDGTVGVGNQTGIGKTVVGVESRGDDTVGG